MNPDYKPAIDVDELVEYLTALIVNDARAEHPTHYPIAEETEHVIPRND